MRIRKALPVLKANPQALNKKDSIIDIVFTVKPTCLNLVNQPKAHSIPSRIAKNKSVSAFTLLEILVSMILLGILVVSFGVSFVTVKRWYKDLEYRLPALNIAREIMEFGEAGKFGHPFAFYYYYSAYPGTTVGNTAYQRMNCAAGGCICDCDSNGQWGCSINCSRGGRCSRSASCTTTRQPGYGIKEWVSFRVIYSNPFMFLGDIGAKGLVPRAAAQSVVIYYETRPTPLFYNAYKETAEISWKDDLRGDTKKEILSVIPIKSVNDQLRLNTAEFWWENL